MLIHDGYFGNSEKDTGRPVRRMFQAEIAPFTGPSYSLLMTIKTLKTIS